MTNHLETLATLAGTLDGCQWNHPLRSADAVRWAVEEIARLTTWQPMKTAPRNGTEVLLWVAYRAGSPNKCLVGHYMPGGHCIDDHPPIDEGWYFWNGCMFDRAAKPVAWMPIPECATPAKEKP
jgi:hypothetical protein